MAEVKKPAPKPNTEPKPKPVSKESAEDFFSSVRDIFMDTIKKLTDYQKDFEKIVADFNSKGKKYQNDVTSVMTTWFDSLKKVQDQLAGIAKNTFSNYIPANINFPFAGEFEKMSSAIQEQLTKYFSAFPLFK